MLGFNAKSFSFKEGVDFRVVPQILAFLAQQPRHESRGIANVLWPRRPSLLNSIYPPSIEDCEFSWIIAERGVGCQEAALGALTLHLKRLFFQLLGDCRPSLLDYPVQPVSKNYLPLLLALQELLELR